jgi:Tfp pilus assembly protein PilO
VNLNIENTSTRKLQIGWSILGLLAIATMGIAWWLCCAKPALELKAELERRAIAVNELRASEPEILLRHKALQGEFEDWNSRIELLKSRIQVYENEGQFLKWVNETANANGLTMRDYRPGQHQKQGDYDCRAVQLSAQGSYESICKFLSQVRSGPKMLRITSLELTPKEKTSGSYTCNLQMLLFSQSNTTLQKLVKTPNAS